MRKAEKAAGGQGFVTIDTLKDQLNSPAWESLKDLNSVLCRVLLSKAFKDAKKNITEPEQISADILLLYGVLLC